MTHARHPGNVVYLISHQGQKIDDQPRGNTKFLQYTRLIHNSLGHGVYQGDVWIYQLGHVLVTGGYNNRNARLTGLPGQGADHIIGLYSGLTDKRQAHGFDNFVDGLDLFPQFIGHGRAIGLVLRVHIIPKGFTLGIENHRQGAIGIILLQAPEHVYHTLDRAGRMAGGGNQWRQGVKGPVDVGGAVN